MRRLALIAAAGVVLAGCGDSHTSTSATRLRYPVVNRSPRVFSIPREAANPGVNLRTRAMLASRMRLGILTVARYSCPLVPDEVTVLGPHEIRISASPHVLGCDRVGNRVLTPRGWLVAIDPKTIDVHRPLTVRLVSDYSDDRAFSLHPRGREKPEVLAVAPLQR